LASGEGDVVVEHGTELLRFAPQRIVLLCIEPGRLGMIDWAESHSLKSVLFDPVAEIVDDLGVFRIEQAMCDIKLGILFRLWAI